MVKEFTKDEWENLLVSNQIPAEGKLVSHENDPTEDDRPIPQPNEQLVVVEKIVHISKATNTTSFETNFERIITSDEEVWRRERWSVGPDWKLLDLGWFEIENVGMVSVRHRPNQFQVRPTAEQLEEINSKVVEISFDGQRVDLLLPPPESVRLNIAHNQVFLRCPSGFVELSLTILPR